MRYASQLPTDEQWQSDLLCIVLDMLNYAGVFKALVGVADKLLENLTDRVFEELMYPVFGSMPNMELRDGRRIRAGEKDGVR